MCAKYNPYSAPSLSASVSAAIEDFTFLSSFFDLQSSGHLFPRLSYKNIIRPPCELLLDRFFSEASV